MQLYATIHSERATKGQGGEVLDIVIMGAHRTELLSFRVQPDGAGYSLKGWTHDNHYIKIELTENLNKGEKEKGECELSGCGIDKPHAESSHD